MPTTPEKPIGARASNYMNRGHDALARKKQEHPETYKNTKQCASVAFRKDKKNLVGMSSFVLDPADKFSHAEYLALNHASSTRIANYKAGLEIKKESIPIDLLKAAFAEVTKVNIFSHYSPCCRCIAIIKDWASRMPHMKISLLYTEYYFYDEDKKETFYGADAEVKAKIEISALVAAAKTLGVSVKITNSNTSEILRSIPKAEANQAMDDISIPARLALTTNASSSSPAAAAASASDQPGSSWSSLIEFD